jgi:hypothetical protein
MSRPERSIQNRGLIDFPQFRSLATRLQVICLKRRMNRLVTTD